MSAALKSLFRLILEPIWPLGAMMKAEKDAKKAWKRLSVQRSVLLRFKEHDAETMWLFSRCRPRNAVSGKDFEALREVSAEHMEERRAS